MRILLLQDDVMPSTAVCIYLRAKGIVVDAVTSLAKARGALRATPYAAVLLDLPLAGADGLALLPQVRSLKERPCVIVLTEPETAADPDRESGATTGTVDYLVKPCDPSELLARLRALEVQQGVRNTPLLCIGDLEIDLVNNEIRRGGGAVTLTQKEWALLRVMAARPDRIHTRERLQDALYGFHDQTDSNTLEVFISHLRRKLGRAHIQTLRGLGYRLVQSAPPCA